MTATKIEKKCGQEYFNFNQNMRKIFGNVKD